MNSEIKEYSAVQNIALKVLVEIDPFIVSGRSEAEIANQCIKLLEKNGIKDCWYHGVPAFVLAGERSILSMSGRDYKPSDSIIKTGDLVTIDLSPELNGYWGDCARSYSVENPEFEKGIKAEKSLHQAMQSVVTPQMTMHELYLVMNAEIKNLGYENLDFKGNLGHSIEKEIDSRRYIEFENYTALGEVMLFTFEPHIRKPGSIHGFKRENIYYFEGEKAVPLGSSELLEVL